MAEATGSRRRLVRAIVALACGLALVPMSSSSVTAAPLVNVWEPVTPGVTGNPAVVTATNGDWTDAFVRKGLGITHHRYGTSSSAPQNLGGLAATDPTAATLGSQTYVFTVGIDRAVYFRIIGSNGLPANIDWQSLGGVVDIAPTAVTTGPNQITLYAVGSDRHLYARQNNGGLWTQWFLVGGLFTDPVASNGPTGLSVVGRGVDGAVWATTLIGPATWTSFTSLGGQIVGSPSASGVDVAALAPDNQIYLTKIGCNGGCTWFATGGFVKNPPSLAAGGMHVSKNLQVYGVGPDSKVYVEYWGSGRSGWQTFAGGVRSRVAVTILDPATCGNTCFGDRLYVVGTDGALYTRLV